MRIGTYNVHGVRGCPLEAAAQVFWHPNNEAAGVYFARVFEVLRAPQPFAGTGARPCGRDSSARLPA